MDSKRRNKTLSAREVDQLLAAIRDIDDSVAHLRKLLQTSVSAQTRASALEEQPLSAEPKKTVH